MFENEYTDVFVFKIPETNSKIDAGMVVCTGTQKNKTNSKREWLCTYVRTAAV
jgi:hypothetical protein